MRNIYSTTDARKLARRYLPWMVFDYIDGAAGEEYGEELNRRIILGLRLQTRVLNNVENRCLKMSVFGKETHLPFGISPMGMCNLAAPGADMMLARLASSHHIPLGVSTAASTPLENLFEAAQSNAWFQLYFSGNLQQTKGLIKRAENVGYSTLILTVDVPEVGRRPRELRRGFKMPFEVGPQQILDFACHPRWSFSTLWRGRPELANFGGDYGEFERTASRAGADWGLLGKIRDIWKGNLVIKGVLSARDAIKMKEMGVDAIQVSSHGGRQLDSAPPAILALARIRDAVGHDFPLFYDSGLRSGEDIIKAYAMGANFVFLGRPLLFAMAALRDKGLNQIVDIFATEISVALAQLGICRMRDIDTAMISDHNINIGSRGLLRK